METGPALFFAFGYSCSIRCPDFFQSERISAMAPQTGPNWKPSYQDAAPLDADAEGELIDPL